MLVLRFKPGQQLVINKTIMIGVNFVGNNNVELSIEAPFVMPIERNDQWVGDKVIKERQQRQRNNKS